MLALHRLSSIASTSTHCYRLSTVSRLATVPSQIRCCSSDPNVVKLDQTGVAKKFGDRRMTAMDPRQPIILQLGAKGGQKKFEQKRLLWSFGSIAMLVIPAFAFCLGCWQVFRLQWKLELIEQLKQRLHHPAVPFPIEDVTQIADMEYRRVRLDGEFLHDREFIISPRGRFDEAYSDKSGGSLLSSDSPSSHGGHVITPFRIHASPLVIMVNRGWIPQEFFEQKYRVKSCPTGRQSLDAIVRKSEARPQFVSENQPERGVWFYKDFKAMGEACGASPIYVEAVSESTLPGGPIGGQTNINIRNEHMSYIVTWYTLTIATFGMWVIRFLK